jgi:hypothetical protein
VDPPVGQSLVPGAVPTTVSESENKIYLGSIPTHFNEMQVRAPRALNHNNRSNQSTTRPSLLHKQSQHPRHPHPKPQTNDRQVRELVSAFGELRAFNLVKDLATGNSRGFCFFEYTDTNLTDRVCQVRACVRASLRPSSDAALWDRLDGHRVLTLSPQPPPPPPPLHAPSIQQELNGFELGDRKLVCQRANTGPRGATLPNQMGMGDNPYAALMGMAGMGGLAAMGAAALAPLPPATRVLKVRCFGVGWRIDC